MNSSLEKKVRKNKMIKRQDRIRYKIKKISDRSNTVFKSNNHIYAQLIDDSKGITVASSSSLEKE